MGNNELAAFVCNEIVSLGTIFDGAVFSMKRSQAQFFVKYCIQRPFVENVTAIIKLWGFLEGVSLSRKKKVKQKPLPCIHQDVTFFLKTFRCLRC